VLLDAAGGAPQAILLATGSELPIAVEAHEKLTAAGVRTRVVSLPCWEAFAAQDKAYQQSVLPSEVTARVSIEAGATFGWRQWIGDRGVAIGLDRFGASAPDKIIYKELGLTADHVVKAVQGLLPSTRA
jgi:transketolase